MTQDAKPSSPPEKPAAPPVLRSAWDHFQEGGLRRVAERAAGRLRRGHQYALYHASPRRLVRRPESVPIDRPLFILGVQGGGITVLARSLYRHPRAVYASGSARFWAGPDEIHNCRHITDLPEPLVHRSYMFRNVEGKLPHHPRYGYQRAWLYAIDEFLPAFRRTAADADPETARRFRRVLQKLILAYADDPDDARFVDMSQLYTIQVPYVAKLLEGCEPRFLLVSRNPYATCARAVEKEYIRERGTYIEDDVEERIRCAADHWANSYRIALESEGDVPMMTLRYEDYLDRPEETIRRICEFAQLDFHPHQVPQPHHRLPLGSVDTHKWYPLRPAENERYIRGIDPRLVARLNERAGDLIERLGYERIEPEGRGHGAR